MTLDATQLPLKRKSMTTACASLKLCLLLTVATRIKAFLQLVLEQAATKAQIVEKTTTMASLATSRHTSTKTRSRVSISDRSSRLLRIAPHQVHLCNRQMVSSNLLERHPQARCQARLSASTWRQTLLWSLPKQSRSV